MNLRKKTLIGVICLLLFLAAWEAIPRYIPPSLAKGEVGGRIGVTRSADDQVSVVVNPCGIPIDEVILHIGTTEYRYQLASESTDTLEIPFSVEDNSWQAHQSLEIRNQETQQQEWSLSAHSPQSWLAAKGLIGERIVQPSYYEGEFAALEDTLSQGKVLIGDGGLIVEQRLSDFYKCPSS